MKTFIILVLIATNALATELPKVLKEKIQAELQLRIPCLDRHSVKEVKTDVRIDRIDQGVIDYYYTSTFTFSYYADSYHPTKGKITIKSAEYSGWCQNDCNFRIEEMDTTAFICE